MMNVLLVISSVLGVALVAAQVVKMVLEIVRIVKENNRPSAKK